MNAEIICVGTELLLGNIVNTNATYISQKLSEIGINVYYQTVVGDNGLRLETNINTAIERSDIIILTGGLGPTTDDLTKEVVAKSLGLNLVEDKESRANINKYFASQNRTPVESNYKQCLSPEGAIILPNSIGTAPGYCIEKDGKYLILLPGPPKELKAMFESSVFPYLRSISDSQLVSHYIMIFGVGESKAEELLGDLTKGENPTVATYANDGEVMIRVTAKSDSLENGEELCAPIISKIKEIFGDNIYAIDNKGLENSVINALKSKNFTVATAESCTGGMVAQKITSVSGSSTVFKAGVIAYSNEIKQKELNISEKILSKYGAVSEQTAAQMAINVRKKENSNLGIGITGIAGPEGSEGKKVGLVYVAIADGKYVWVRKLQLFVGYDRDKIRNYATATALDLIRRYIDFLPDMLSGGSLYDDNILVLETQPVRSTKKVDIIEVTNKTETESGKNIISDNELMDLMYNIFEEEVNKQTNNTIKDETIIASLRNKTKKSTASKKVFKERLKSLCVYVLNALPNKKSSKKDNIIKSLFIIALSGLIISSCFLANYFLTGNKQKELIENTREIFNSQHTSSNFSSLLEINKDVKAWIKIEGTEIDNPIVQANNNDYYLNHDFSGKKSRYGTLFLDYRDIISENGNSQNLVVYGHNMKDGSMFAGLHKYKNLNFYNEHPTFSLLTSYGKCEYQVFSVFLINSKASDDNGNIYNFLKNSFETQEEFLSWINEAKLRSLIKTNVDISEGNEILTLVTCAYEFNDARLVVMAKRISDDEVESINTSSAKYNSSPKYPQIWYDKRGLKNPYLPESQVSSAVSQNSSNMDSVPSNDKSSQTSDNTSQNSILSESVLTSSITSSINSDTSYLENHQNSQTTTSEDISSSQ